jgi:hypothetical protein
LCSIARKFGPWPEKDGSWVLLPVVEVVANRLRADEAPEHTDS